MTVEIPLRLPELNLHLLMLILILILTATSKLSERPAARSIAGKLFHRYLGGSHGTSAED